MRKGKPPPPCARQDPQTSRPYPQGRPLGRHGLITANDHVDVERIELDAAADATGLVGGDEVEPEPRKGSSTISPRLVRSSRASSSIAAGLTVGWSCKPRRASEPSDEAPG